MRLNEIFDTRERTRDTKDILSRREHIKDLPDYGVFGRVRPDKSDPHMIKKTPLEPFAKDGYFTYIKYIVDNKIAQSNPFAPRVYKIDLYKQKGVGAKKYNIQMEKLIHLEDLPEEQVLAMYQQISGYSEEKIKSFYIHEYDKLLAAFVSGITYGSLKSLFDDLNSLCKTISEISVKGNFHIDIHRGNIMVRMTPVGPQLVITDPLA